MPIKESSHLEPRDGERGGDVEWTDSDGRRTVAEVKANSGGIRDLRAMWMTMALKLATRPDVNEGLLVLLEPRLKPSTVAHEWQLLQPVLAESVRERLNVIVRQGDLWWSPKPRPSHRAVQEWAAVQLQRERVPTTQMSASSGRGFEVWKQLLLAWMLREGPVGIGQLGERASVSHPTVSRVVRLLERSHELVQHRDRKVELVEFPSRSFASYRPLLESVRRTQYYKDASGQRTDFRYLIKVIGKAGFRNLAVGGVVAAEHYDPAFDLVGVPRIDVVVGPPDGARPDSAMLRVDAALQRTDSSAEAVIALHVTDREGLGRDDSGVEIAYADEVETWLDLQQLDLPKQANDFVRFIRARGAKP